MTVFFQGLTLSHALLDTDESGYSSIAALMNAGGRLYAGGGVDNKPPVVFWVYSIVFRLFGQYDLTAVHVVKVVVVLATAAVVGVIAHRLAGAAAAWAAALLYVAFTAAGYPQMAAANTEVFMMLPASVSILLLLDGRWAAAGAALALAVMTKQVAVFQLALFPLAALYPKRAPLPLLLGAGGFVAGIAALLAVLALTGSVEGFWQWAVRSLVVSYGPSAWRSGQALAGIHSDALPWIGAALLLWAPALLRLLDLPRGDRATVLLSGWLATSAAGVVAGGHFFGHYFIQVVGPLAALSGAAGAEWRRYVTRPAVAALAALLLAVPALRSVYTDYKVVDPAAAGEGGRPTQAEYLQVSDYIRGHTTPGQRIFVWGNWPSVYVYARRVPASRFVGFLRGGPRGPGIAPRTWDTVPAVWPLLAQDLAAHPAALLIDTSTADWASFASYPMSRFPVLPGIVAARYERLAVVDGVTIYRLR